MKIETGICCNCGGDEGIHQYETMRCPKFGREEMREGHKQEWIDSTFEDSGLKKLYSNSYELLDSLIKLQKHLESLINSTPSGDYRNTLTDDNIKALSLINKFNY